MAFQLHDDKTATATLSAKDSKGNPTTVKAATWGSSDPKILTVTPSANGMSAVIAPVGPLGTAQVQFADNDVTPPLTGTADVEVISGAAASVSITLAENA